MLESGRNEEAVACSKARLELNVGVPRFSVRATPPHARHVEGCFASGPGRDTHLVTNSKAAMGDLRELVEEDGANVIEIVVNGPGKKPPSKSPKFIGETPERKNGIRDRYQNRPTDSVYD